MSAGSEVDEELEFREWMKACATSTEGSRMATARNAWFARAALSALTAPGADVIASRADRASAAPTEGVEPVALSEKQRDALNLLCAEIEAMHEEPEEGCVLCDAAKTVRAMLAAAPTRPAAPDAVEALREDAERYRWLRSEGLAHIRWEGLTTETCDVGLDGAIDIARSVLQQIDGKKG